MSDQEHEPGPRHGVPIWVFVVSLVSVVIITGSTVWALRVRDLRGTPVAVIATSTVTPSATPTTPATIPTTTVPATGTPSIEPTKVVTPATLKQPARVTHMTWSASKGYRITADYVQILTGQAAADAATAAGEESPPPNDYFIANQSAKLRTFSLSKAASITVLGWGGADATAKHALTVGQFMDIMPGGVNPQEEYAGSLYYLTIKNGTTVTKVEMIFFP